MSEQSKDAGPNLRARIPEEMKGEMENEAKRLDLSVSQYIRKLHKEHMARISKRKS